MKRWIRRGAAVVLATFLALEGSVGAVGSQTDDYVLSEREKAVSDEEKSSFLLLSQNVMKDGGDYGVDTPSAGKGESLAAESKPSKAESVPSTEEGFLPGTETEPSTEEVALPGTETEPSTEEEVLPDTETIPSTEERVPSETAPSAGGGASSETAPSAGDGASSETAPSAGDETSSESESSGGEGETTGESSDSSHDVLNLNELEGTATPSDAPAETKIRGREDDGGSLKIEIRGVMPGRGVRWKAELIPDGDPDGDESAHEESRSGSVRRAEIYLPAVDEQAVWASVTITGIESGEYLLKLTPNGNDNSYLPYSQMIEIDENQTKICLINGDPVKYGYSDDADKFGALAMGDINGDEKLDEADLDEILRLAAKGSVQENDVYKRADLNGDGKTDLLDVDIFSGFYENDWDGKEAEPIHTVLIHKDEVAASQSNASVKDGSSSLPEMFAGVNNSALRMEASEAISEEKPLEITAEFTSGAKMMEGLQIDPVFGSGGSIRDGEVEVETEDGDIRVFSIKEGEVIGESQRHAGEEPYEEDEEAEPLEHDEEIMEAALPELGEKIMEAALPELDELMGRAALTEADEPMKVAALTEADEPMKVAALTEADEPTERAALMADVDVDPDPEAEQTMERGVPIVIELGNQVPVKKITIRVTKTMDSLDLVEISKVEFFDDMADRIPEPDMARPERVTVENYSEAFTVRWKSVPNVTGYSVEVTGPAEGKGTVTQTFLPEENECEVVSLNGGDLINGETYTVKIRSVNGAWRSDAVVVEANPDAESLPPAPEDLVITPGGQFLKVSWKKMKDTESYTLYYRDTESKGTEFASVPQIEKNSCTIEKLKENTEYEIYLTGHNRIGTGPQSLHYKVRTSTMNPPETPNYRLINVPEEGRDATAHIESVDLGDGTSADPFDIVDGRYDTYWVLGDWDSGYFYGKQAAKVTFDDVYEINSIVLVPDESQPYSLGAGKINYWDENGDKKTVEARMIRKSSNGKYYYMFYTLEPIRARSVQLAVYTYGSGTRIGVAELKFYRYDSIEKEIMDLYGDSLHVTLRTEPEVTQDTIDGLRARLKVPDEASGELHPRKTELDKELDNAEKILRDGSGGVIIRIDNKDTVKRDGHITFRSGLNTFQPLGVTALAGETVTVYAGGPGHRDGDNTRLELYMAQYHGSSAAVFKSMGYLKAGANEITIEALDKMDKERGGQLYVEYTGEAGNEEYGVRVIGGHKSAFLDLSDETDHSRRVELAGEYLRELTEQNGQCRSLHEQDHASYGWEPENCIYQATDIVTRYTMISTAAQQVLSGLKAAAESDSVEDMAEQLVSSMDAMDQMMTLFYHHKGLSDAEDAPDHNKMPASRINIRYQRMFAGAFMYAGGRHIGIEWPELKGLMGGQPITADENGRKQDGSYFGWGIAHEIGHEINEGAYAVAEVTNNYFSVLAQALDNNDSVRFKYDDVYNKVTSGTKGKAGNVFVQLAMYWQLHLAYDLGGYNYKIYDTNREQLDNLIFARMDSYARKPDTAPGADGNKLSLTGADTDNKLMRLAVAATQKDILEFFRRWGLEPDEGTVCYAGQFEKETKGIWFANDDIRAKQLESGGKSGYTDQAAQTEVTGNIAPVQDNRVTLNLSSDESIWMYEIYRYERIKGDIVRRPVGYAFAEDGSATFTDVVGTVNNRAFTYEATGYDMWLNPTRRAEIGTVKVSHSGLIDKKLWTVESNLTNGDYVKPDKDNPDTGEQPGLENMVDDHDETVFAGKTEDGSDPEIILNLNRDETITGISYIASVDGRAADGLEIYVSTTGHGDWTRAKTNGEPVVEGEKKIVHFNDGVNLFTYDASYVRLVAKGMAGKELRVAELSLLGQTGDNVELKTEGGIGILKDAYTGTDGNVLIPAGSIIFTGIYKGNPAYNTVLLWDESNHIVGGTDEDGNILAEQIIFAPVPEGKGLLGEVSDGIWVYYVKPEYKDSVKAGKVRAELYRTDDALTQQGERLVSSTEFAEVPAQLPNITLKAGGVEQ